MTTRALVGGRTKLHRIRYWLFSPVGLLCAWVIAIGLLLPAGAMVLLTLHERYSIPLATLGMWWLAGTIVVHWWIPTTAMERSWREGIASAGWHVASVMAATGLVAWYVLFRDGIHSGFLLSDTRPVLAAWIASTVLFGGVLIWVRGHNPARTLRYGVFSLSIGAAWMAVWLVVAHAGV